MNKVLLMVYPCRNGDRIFLGAEPRLLSDGTPMRDGLGYPTYKNKQYTLRSGGKNEVISAWHARALMEDEGFFEVMPGSCPLTASGEIEC